MGDIGIANEIIPDGDFKYSYEEVSTEESKFSEFELWFKKRMSIKYNVPKH